MAETKMQTQTSDPQQSVARRRDYELSRDPFRVNPFSMMRRFTEEMDRVFGSGFGPWSLFGGAGWSGESAWAPPVEVRERDGKVEVTAELPGLSKEDVKVECSAEGLVIQGEKRREREFEEGGLRRSERVYGRFYRQIPLPDGAETDKARADFKNGVLQVQIPLAESRQKNRQIPISG